MDSPSKKIFPPLKTWFLLVVAADLLFVWIYFTEKSNRMAENECRQTYISSRFQRAGGNPVVFIIGTSLVEAGVCSSDSISACLQETSGEPIQVVKVWKPAATLSSFATDLPSLQRVNPGLVVIEANMLFYRGVEEPFLSRYLQTFRDMLAFKNSATPYNPDVRHPFKPLGNLSIDDIRGGLIDTSDLSAFRKMAEHWQSGGTRFLLVNFPIENSLEARKWNSVDTASFFRNLNYLKQKISLAYVGPQLQLDSSYFFDLAHLNNKGNRIFSSFFCRSVAAQLKKR
jgi:hypothetical protein